MCEMEKEKASGAKVTSPKTKKVAITFLLEISGGNGLLTINCKGCWDVITTSGFGCIFTVCRLGVRSSGGKNPSCTRELKRKRRPPFTPSIHSQQNQLYTYIKARVVRSGTASRGNPQGLWNFRLDICFWLLKRYPQAIGTRRI